MMARGVSETFTMRDPSVRLTAPSSILPADREQGKGGYGAADTVSAARMAQAQRSLAL